MFRSAGLDLHDAGTGNDGLPDSAADIERIVAHKGVPQVSTSNADLYTYVQDHEAKHAPSGKAKSHASGASTPQQSGRPSVDAIPTTHDLLTPTDKTASRCNSPFGMQREAQHVQQPQQTQTSGQDPTFSLDRSQYIQQDVDMIMGDRAQYMMPVLAAGADLGMEASPLSLQGFESASKIWWDHSFDALDTDPSGFLLGGFSGEDGGDYFIPPC